MRLVFNFRNDGKEWWSDEIRTYNGRTPGDWIYYRGEFFRSPLGTRFQGSLEIEGKSEDGLNLAGKIHFENLSLEAYSPSDQ